MTSTAAVEELAAALPVDGLTTQLYVRQCHLPADQDADPTFIPTPQADGRWQTEGGTLYVAEQETTCWAEYCRNNASLVQDADPTGGVGLAASTLPIYFNEQLGMPLPARAVFSVAVVLTGVCDLTSPLADVALTARGIDPQMLIADDHQFCVALSQAGERLGWQAVRARSAAMPDQTCVAMLSGGFPDRSLWQEVRQAARPTVSVAYVTRYRTGQRPRWLPAEAP